MRVVIADRLCAIEFFRRFTSVAASLKIVFTGIFQWENKREFLWFQEVCAKTPVFSFRAYCLQKWEKSERILVARNPPTKILRIRTYKGTVWKSHFRPLRYCVTPPSRWGRATETGHFHIKNLPVSVGGWRVSAGKDSFYPPSKTLRILRKVIVGKLCAIDFLLSRQLIFKGAVLAKCRSYGVSEQRRFSIYLPIQYADSRLFP